MADLSLQELEARLSGLGGGTVAATSHETLPTETELEPPAQEPMSLLPLSSQKIDEIASRQAVTSGARPQKVAPSRFDMFSRLGARPGIPFDKENGISWRDRLTMEREPTFQEQLQALHVGYGKENVRLNDFGQPVVTTVGDDGKMKDVLVNPIGLDWGDTATLVSQSPEIAGSLLPLLLTGGATLGPGVLRAIGTLALSTGGGGVRWSGQGYVQAVDGRP